MTHNNAGESKLYVDGVLDDSESAGSHNAGFYALNVGINRSDNPAKTWKGATPRPLRPALRASQYPNPPCRKSD